MDLSVAYTLMLVVICLLTGFSMGCSYTEYKERTCRRCKCEQGRQVRRSVTPETDTITPWGYQSPSVEHAR